jgi:CRISPR-associated RAMP protein (TIGR02581 family)
MVHQWVTHSILLRECLLTGYIVIESPTRVGAGREAPLGSPVDLAVVRIKLNGKLVPYIPGSSIKGVFRNVAVQLAKAKGLNVCSGLSKETCMDKEYAAGETLLDRIQSLLREGSNFEALDIFSEKACLLCKIFGAPSFSGHVSFSDAYPVDERGNVLDVLTGVRAGIAIDRRTGAAYPGALYHVEYVEPGSKFKFMIHTTNLPNYAIGLLAKILRMIHQGWVRIGGFKTRGFGEVSIESLRFIVKGAKIEGSKLLALDERDEAVDLGELPEKSGDGLGCSDSRAWECLAKFEEVWERAKLT